MPDLRDDTTDDGFHEIQFSSKQLVFLFMAASVSLILVFLVGVVVGRDTTTKATEPSISADDPEVAATPQAGSDDAKPTASDEPPPAQGEAAATPPGGDLSYPKSLGAKNPEPTTASKPTVDPPAPPPVADSKPAQTKPEPAAKPADAGPNVPTSGRPGQWVIQVSALRTRQAAAESVQRLRAKGYDAYLEDTAKGLYRVRVGKFKDRNEAERVARRLDKEEGSKSVVQR